MTKSSGHRSTVPPGEQAERVGFSGYRLERTATRGSRSPLLAWQPLPRNNDL